MRSYTLRSQMFSRFSLSLLSLPPHSRSQPGHHVVTAMTSRFSVWNWSLEKNLFGKNTRVLLCSYCTATHSAVDYWFRNLHFVSLNINFLWFLFRLQRPPVARNVGVPLCGRPSVLKCAGCSGVWFCSLESPAVCTVSWVPPEIHKQFNISIFF